MKVDKETFLFCLEYLGRLNRRDLNHLDLSDFFDKDFKFTRVESYSTSAGVPIDETISDNIDQAIEHWRFTGLNNKEFILNYME